MNEENNVNQETEEKVNEKAKKMNEVFSDMGEMVIEDVVKIAGRDLTDAEKKDVLNSLKAFFIMSSLMLKAVV